jgi:hypothetical protein
MTRKLTVSEFIRESKPDWNHVRTEDKRSSTKPFSGAPVVDMQCVGVTDAQGRLRAAHINMEYATSFAEQMERFDQQNLAGAQGGPSYFYDDDDVTIRDVQDDDNVYVASYDLPKSRLPGSSD